MAKVPYASTISSLMYAMVCTRPNIAHAMRVVSRYISNPRKQHWEAVKWILWYLIGTASLALYFKQSDLGLQGYIDVNMVGDVDGRKSITMYVYTLGGTTISWVSKLQKIIALSNIEAEYVAITKASKEIIWLQLFLEELGQKQENEVLHCDIQSVIHLVNNHVYHARTKCIQVKYHFIKSAFEDGALVLEKIIGSLNPANMLTTIVPVKKLKLWATSVGLLLKAWEVVADADEDIMFDWSPSGRLFKLWSWINKTSRAGRNSVPQRQPLGTVVPVTQTFCLEDRNSAL